MAQSENKQEMQQDLTEHTETSPTDVQGDLTKTQISGSDHATEPTEPVSDVTATDVATEETENTVSKESTDDVTLTDGQQQTSKQTPRTRLRGRKWIENFWYHHKFGTIAGMVALITVVVCTLQMCGRTKPDLYVMYCGSEQMSQNRYNTLREELAEMAPSDYNEDGEISVDLIDIVWLSDAYCSMYENQGYNVDAAANDTSKMQFNTEIQSGQNVLCLLNVDLYLETQETTQAFATWEETLGYVPQNALDDCAIFLSDLPFGQLPGVRLPADTVLCMRKKGELSLGKSSEERDRFYAYHVEALKTIVEYGQID